MAKKIPVVSIIGRQNVGKSTLFNALIRQKKAIVDATPGLTRDIISFTVNHNDASFILSDTPGLDLADSSALSAAILENARAFLEKSSVIILLMENPAPAGFDYDLAGIVRKLSIPVIVAVNKMDHAEEFHNLDNFYQMGFAEILPISALKKVNLPLLLDTIVHMLPAKRQPAGEAYMKISIVGRPNSGKSTLLNSLIGYTRSIVSDIPGTTRDSVDEDFIFHEKRITVIDTAGIHRKSRITDNIDYYSLTRSLESIRRCDVVINLIDATQGLTETDKKIADEIIGAKKPMIIAINKWDAIEKSTNTFREFTDRLIFQFYRAQDFPIISISAREKLRIHRLVTMALELYEKSTRRIETSKLNKIIEDIQARSNVPMLGARLKIYYATQTETRPPQFKLFVNNAELFRKEIVRAIEKILQKRLDMEGIPLNLAIEGKKKSS